MNQADVSHTGLILLAAALLALAAPTAGARAQAALATEVRGTTSPVVEPFSELEAGSGIELAADAEIEFVHYASCKAVRVRGGRLSVTARSFAVSGGGRVLDVSRADCPAVITLGPSPEIGGLLVREGGGDVKVSRRPLFVLVGSESEDPARIVVSHGTSELVAAAPVGRTLRWPDDAPPLQAGQDYAIALFAADGSPLGRFAATASGAMRDGAPTLLRLH